MSYDEPPEWRGRGATGREGWPNRTFESTPGGPRSHRRPGDERVALRRDDTGEFRPSREPFADDMPTEEMQGVRVPPRRPVLRPHFVLERDRDPLARLYLWLGVGVRILALVALVCAIWLLGMCLAVGGVPLWVAGS